MDTQYLKAIWDKACEEMDDMAMDISGVSIEKRKGFPAFTLPFFDQAQQLVEFIKHHDLEALQRMKQPLTQEDASWLLSRYSIEDIEGVLMDMENYPRLNSKYKSCKLTANNWLRKRTKDNGKNKSNQKIRIV